jgi:Mn-dependent DtxR family transcriptional regulator
LRKFKYLSQQEFKVFSSIYSLEETEEIVDYSTISLKLGLTESSIRDYVMKIEKKGIPIIKEKLQNRRISLHIRKELRDLFTLDKLLKIRESASLKPFLVKGIDKEEEEDIEVPLSYKEIAHFEVPNAIYQQNKVVDKNTENKSTIYY